MLTQLFRGVVLLFTTISISSCFSISKENQLISSSGVILNNDRLCSLAVKLIQDNDDALNEKGFSLVSWNIFKGNQKGWKEDLLSLSDESDLILLQEVYLTHTMNQLLESAGQDWDMISAFRYKGIHTGVMTMADISSLSRCAHRTNEPLVRLPKSALISYFPIANSEQHLLVVNIHSINFTPVIDPFTTQLMEIIKVLEKHNGPIVFAGDFNTWSQQRQDVLNLLTGKLGLNKVEFSNTAPIHFWGRHVDHIFFKDLRVIKAEAIPVTSSDHYPLKVYFKFLPEDSGAQVL